MVPLCSEKFSLLPPLYVPVSPVARAARCNPCPVALVPTLGCSRPPSRNLDLVRSALSGRIIPESIFILNSKRSLHFSGTSSYPARKEAPAHPDAFAVLRRARARAARERRFPLVCTHAHVPTARSGTETAQGGAPANPTLIGSDKKSTYNANITHQQQVSVLCIPGTKDKNTVRQDEHL